MASRRALPEFNVFSCNDDRGLTTVEYVILLVVIAIMSVAGWHKFGSAINGKLADSQKEFDANVTDKPVK